jgi:menaquinone-9 beta-reductase
MAAAADVLVIGGGIAGAAVAAHLGRAGRKAVLIERKAQPHDKVCGEFVSGDAAVYLHGLGIDLENLGAVRISTVRVYARRDVVSASLPFPAFSISRRVLDEAVLGIASARGADLRRGRAVRSLRPLDGGWIAGLDDGSTLAARDAFLATGKRDLKGWKRPPGRQNEFVAFKMHWRLSTAQAAALAASVELFLFPGGYAGLALVENGVANLCLVVGRRHLALLNNRWDLLLSALRSDFLMLHQRLAGATGCWDRPLAIASIPYGHVQRRGIGPWCIGDQAAVTPSFSGDGIAIALHSAQLAVRYYLAGQPSSQFQSRLARDVAGQVRLATLLSRLLVLPEGQAVAMALARLAPSIVDHIAHRTRIPGRLINTEQDSAVEIAMRRALTG